MGRSPSIKSKFIPSYQFILKALHNNELSIDKFIDTTLFSKENTGTIAQTKRKLDSLGDVDETEYNSLNEMEVDEVIKYIKMEDKVNNTVIRLNNKDRKKTIKNMKKIENRDYFKTVYSVIKKINKEYELRDELQRKIDYQKIFVLGRCSENYYYP